MIKATDGNGNATSFCFNAWGKVAVVTDPAGKVETYGYDLEGNPASHTDRNGNTVLYTYNMYGSLTEKRAADGSVAQSYGYYRDGALKHWIGYNILDK